MKGCQKCQAAEARTAEYLGLVNEAQGRIVDLEAALNDLQQLRPALLKQYGAVPEIVLEHCNRARALQEGQS